MSVDPRPGKGWILRACRRPQGKGWRWACYPGRARSNACNRLEKYRGREDISLFSIHQSSIYESINLPMNLPIYHIHQSINSQSKLTWGRPWRGLYGGSGPCRWQWGWPAASWLPSAPAGQHRRQALVWTMSYKVRLENMELWKKKENYEETVFELYEVISIEGTQISL